MYIQSYKIGQISIMLSNMYEKERFTFGYKEICMYKLGCVNAPVMLIELMLGGG